MTPEGEPGVSDFGISSGELPGRRAAGRAADRAADSDSDSAGAGSDDPRFALATEVRRIISAMVGLPLEDDELEAATGVISALADRLEGAAGAGRRPRAQPDPVGAANILSGNPGMTGTLTIRYRKPTPLLTPLRLEAKFVRREGRKIYTTGTIHHGDVLTAEAEGIFIELVPTEFMKIVSENSDSPEAIEQVRADARRLGLTGT